MLGPRLCCHSPAPKVRAAFGAPVEKGKPCPLTPTDMEPPLPPRRLSSSPEPLLIAGFEASCAAAWVWPCGRRGAGAVCAGQAHISSGSDRVASCQVGRCGWWWSMRRPPRHRVFGLLVCACSSSPESLPSRRKPKPPHHPSSSLDLPSFVVGQDLR